MRSLWFIVPAHGRVELARICLRQLWRTCHDLIENGVDASAVVIADDENLDTARELGFGWVKLDNSYTSQKFNEGIYLACNNGVRNVDYVVPCGSDDWVDYRLFLDLPDQDTMVGFQRMAFVREDGREISVRHINTLGGAGIRIWPRKLMAANGYWPADPDRRRGCDTSILVNTQLATPFKVEHRDIDPLQIVDWKSDGCNLNTYDTVANRHRAEYVGDPFHVLQGRYAEESLEEMAALYGLVPA